MSGNTTTITSCPFGYIYIKGECIRSKDWAISISVLCVFLLLLSLLIILLIWILSRRKKRQSSTNFYQRVNIDDFPLTLSKNRIDCSSSTIALPLYTEHRDEVYIYNPSDIQKSFVVECDTHQYELISSPSRAVLGPHTGVTITFTLTLLCTSPHYKDVNIITFDGFAEDDVDDDDKTTTPIAIAVVAEENSLLDYDDISYLDVLSSSTDGNVYTALYNNTTVVAKEFKHGWSSEGRSRFAKACSDLIQYRSPYLVNLIGGIASINHEAIIIEYAEFGNVRTCYHHGDLTTPLKCKIFSDACKALIALHNNNIIHGRIKPQNLLVVSVALQSSVCCKVSDYWSIEKMAGIAQRPLTDDEMLSQAVFTAPEVLRGNDASYMSDVYSLVMVILEVFQEHIIYPERPFSNGWDAVLQVSKGKRPDIPISIPDKIKNIIVNGWNADCDSRPTIQTILNVLAEMLDQLLENDEIDLTQLEES